MRTCRPEDVTAGELPHASEKLSKAAAEKGHTDNDVGVGDAVHSHIVETEDERRAREREETQSRRIGDSGWTGCTGESAACTIVVDVAFLDVAHFHGV